MTCARFGTTLALLLILMACGGSETTQFISTPTSSTSTVVLSPSTVAFTAANQTKSLTVAETGYSGTFTARSSNTAVATVSPSSGTGPFTVTAVGSGSAKITFSANNGTTGTASVGVTITTGTIFSSTK
jgi:hypothetical protein